MTLLPHQYKYGREYPKGGLMLVYCITNLISGKKYVGATTRNLTKRYSLNWSKRLLSNIELRSDFEKLGQKSFNIEVISRPKTIEKMYKLEKHYIRKLNTVFPNGYNFHLGGSKSETVVHKETKKRISETMKNSFLPHRGRCSKEMMPCSICKKEIWSYRIRGKLKSTCSRDCFLKNHSIKMSIVQNKRKMPVYCYLNGELIKKYGCLEETKKDGFGASLVSRAAKRNGTHKGFSWRFI